MSLHRIRIRTNPILRAAIDYAADRNWHVFPVWGRTGDRCDCGDPQCRSGGKHPVGYLVPNGFKDATTDTTFITRWWTEYPEAGIAVETNNLLVFDIDNKGDRNGMLALDQLERRLGPLPVTMESRTPSGGAHKFFQHVEGVGCATDKLAKGIDIRATGGYVVVPPSCDGLYAWVNEQEIAALPARWIEHVRNLFARTEHQRDREPANDDADTNSSAVAAIIRALNGNPRTGMCNCPCHEDDTPSLHVSAGHTVPVIFHCHAGCSQEQLIAWAKNHDLWPKTEQRQQEGDAKITAEQEEWRRLSVAYGILRAASDENKDIVARYLNGRGLDLIPRAKELSAEQAGRLTGTNSPAMVFSIGNDSGLRGAHVTFLSRDGATKLNSHYPRKMFGPVKGGYIILNEVGDPDKPLIIGEGIESTASLNQLAGGLPAIAAGSASNMAAINPPPSSEVLIAVDNDDAGRKAAEELAQRLTAAGRKVKLVPPDGPEGYDWNDILQDALQDGTNLDELRHSILSAGIFKDTKKAYAVSMAELMEMQFPPRTYLVEPWLQTGSLAQLFAKRGIGKTRFSMSLGYAIATGPNSFLGWNIKAAHRVLYVDGELPATLLQGRFNVLGEATENFSILSRDVLLRRRKVDIPDLATPEGRAFVNKVIAEKNSEVVILDSLSTLFKSGVENDAESWAPVQAWLLDLRLREVTVIFLHHEGKGETARGTSKREDPLDTIIRLKEIKSANEEDPDGCAFELHFTKGREFYGPDKAPRLLRLSTRFGKAEWSWEPLRDHQQEQIEELARGGLTQKQIADELGIDQSTVSRALKKEGMKKKNEKTRR